jgi:hypothetical protein
MNIFLILFSSYKQRQTWGCTRILNLRAPPSCFHFNLMSFFTFSNYIIKTTKRGSWFSYIYGYSAGTMYHNEFADEAATTVTLKIHLNYSHSWQLQNSKNGVTPAKAGVQKFLKRLDSRLRGNDACTGFRTEI